MVHSYIVVNKDSGQAVLEFFNESFASHINKAKYDVMTAHDYLCRLNAPLRASNSAGGVVC